MITKVHYITLDINGELADLYSQDNLNLRMNNQLFNPTEIATNTAEYSFSFSLPITDKNRRIFGYADNLAKLNKFNKQYPCLVYADGNEIFNGVLRLSSITKKDFKCNLVNVKINKINDIFGDTKLSDLRWDVDFDGSDTINAVNNDMNSDYYFPLVCYGTFQKKPKGEHLSSFDRYTPKHTLDEYNLWYYESFAPSIKLNSLVKKLFEYKGYNVGGDIFDDDNINNIYLSESIADKQDPLYNIGSDLGRCSVNFTFNNWAQEDYRKSTVVRLLQTLTYQHEPVSDQFNFDTIHNYDLWSQNNKYLTINNSPNKYMWRSNCIAIPADGLYKVDIDIAVDITDARDKMTVWKYQQVTGGRYPEYDDKAVEITKSWENYPVEIQLLKNEHETELIYGVNEKENMFPHESDHAIVNKNDDGTTSYIWNYARKSTPIAYDPKANPNFICGFSTISDGVAYIKNGMSWDSEDNYDNISRYNLDGYKKRIRISKPKTTGRPGFDWETKYEDSDYNKNNLSGVKPSFFSSDGTWSKKGRVSMIVYLKKNDILRLKLLSRAYVTQPPTGNVQQTGYSDYHISIGGNVMVEAYSPKYEQYGNDVNLSWTSIPEKDKFPVKLNLGNFLHNQVKMADFVNNYQKALNLSYRMEGNTVFFDKQYNDITEAKTYVDIDDRVNSDEAESMRIEYPSSMEIKYSIDDEENGFYLSVPYDLVERPDWKDFANIGSEKIKLIDDEDAQDETIDLTHSYCWYDAFQYQAYNSASKAKEAVATLYLPVISKDEYMIEGYKYEESMKHDGKSLKQRWWYRQPVIDRTLTMWNGDIVNITIPTNTYNNHVLEYKNTEGSLLNTYFNINATPDSNLVKIDAYLSPKEYKSIKNGALVKFDNDLYIPTEIQGYDPTANNKTELTLLKKI